MAREDFTHLIITYPQHIISFMCPCEEGERVNWILSAAIGTRWYLLISFPGFAFSPVRAALEFSVQDQSDWIVSLLKQLHPSTFSAVNRSCTAKQQTKTWI